MSAPPTTLKRVDPEQHMDRWYTVAVQPTLLDEVAVVCVWGSRRSRYQRWRILSVASHAEAGSLARKIVQAKLQRGYRTTG